jgi:group I intron endonuclease
MQIYKITNNINGKIYIGKDTKNNKNYFGSGIVIKQAIKKYGKKNFTKEILEECDNYNELNEKEIKWISIFNSTDKNIGYNRSYGGDGFSGITEDTIKKIIEKNTGKKRTEETKKKISDSNKDKPKSEEHKKSLSKAWEKRKIEHPHSKKTLEKMSKSMLGKNAKNTYKLIDMDGNEFIINNLTQFSKDNNLQRTILCKVASGERKHHKGWKCEKINE